MSEAENPDDKHDDPNLEAIYGDIIDDFDAVEPYTTDKDPHDDDPHQHQDPHEETTSGREEEHLGYAREETQPNTG